MALISANNIGSHQAHVNTCFEMLRRCCGTITIYGAFYQGIVSRCYDKEWWEATVTQSKLEIWSEEILFDKPSGYYLHKQYRHKIST